MKQTNCNNGSAGSDYTSIRKTAYRRFQLFWIYDHGFSMDDLFRAFSECAGEIVSDDEGISAENLKELFEETGLGSGSLYPCFDEFLTVEYKDINLMYRLLTEDEFRLYAEDRQLDSFKAKKDATAICVETPHGVIRADNKFDSEYPGIELNFLAKKNASEYGPGATMEFNPYFHGFDHESAAAQEKVVLLIYSKERPEDDPSAGFMME